MSVSWLSWSRCSICAMTTLATSSSIEVPRKMIRSDSNRLNTSKERSPFGVRSITVGIV